MLRIIKFSAEWCGPCKALAPKFKEISEKYASSTVVFQEIDVDKNQELATKYLVRSLPMVVIESSEPNNMIVVERFVGNVPEKIEQYIKNQLKTNYE